MFLLMFVVFLMMMVLLIVLKNGDGAFDCALPNITLLLISHTSLLVSRGIMNE